jgi:DNA mismatch repair protein MutS
VVRVITPGTILEENLLEARQNNYLLALFPADDRETFGLAFIDVSTGEFGATELSREKLKDEIFRRAPGEVIVPQSRQGDASLTAAANALGIPVSTLEDWLFSPGEAEARIKAAFSLQSLKPLGLDGRPCAAAACGAILAYLEKTQVQNLPSLSPVRYYSLDDYLLLDATAIRNLELLEGLASRNREDSLIDVIDSTLTPMGGRLLRQWILQPLLSVKMIRARQDAVGYFVDEGIARRTVRELLRQVADLERILSRVASGSATPRELTGLNASLAALPGLRESLTGTGDLLPLPESARTLAARLTAPPDVAALISAAIADEPPATLKDGGVIREGYHSELDGLRRLRTDTKTLISEMEAKERKRTGIATLKIGYTSVFGYYLEVTKANLSLVPGEYIRKQTVANGERFITPELKSFEEKILSAEDRILKIEQDLYRAVLAGVIAHAEALKTLSAALAELDVFASLADTAAQHRYIRPMIDESHVLSIKDGRHPVIERKLKSGLFVPNDTSLNGEADRIVLITGPNMAGKSTYLRQVALITVLAQVGSYVPCAEATVGIVDRIFTRIGAGDNLAGGESTFMVEMHETANILNQNTARSLIVLDEVGQGNVHL